MAAPEGSADFSRPGRGNAQVIARARQTRPGLVRAPFGFRSVSLVGMVLAGWLVMAFFYRIRAGLGKISFRDRRSKGRDET